MENLNLIRKIAWSFAKSTGLDAQDLICEASLAYCEAKERYDPNRGASWTTFAWTHMRNHLTTYTKKEKFYGSGQSIEFLVKTPAPQPFSREDFFVMLNSWPETLKQIAELTIMSGETIADLPPKIARGVIVDQLRQQGWPWSKIWDGIRDLKMLLSKTELMGII